MQASTAIEPDPLFPRSTYAPIQDYGAIGNCRAAALVSRGGSIDWLCLPRFDSPAVFAALLDAQKGGRFVIRPAGAYSVSRSYVGATNVLRTEFRTASGAAHLTDLMPVTTEERSHLQFWPDHEVLRIVECVEGEIEIEMLCDPRPNFGAIVPTVRRAGFPGWLFVGDAQTLMLLSEIETAPIGHRPGVYGKARLRAGERRTISLAFSANRPSILPVPGAAAMDRLEQTLRWWGSWSSRCTYSGPHRDAVVRSALALKLMVYAPSGAIIAAPTTSLPETIGGIRNWDYRYCWLRDASFTIRALLELGYTEEAGSFISWLFSATRRTWPRLGVLYDVFGESRQRETLLPLEGYAGSRPVRIGNAAHDQLQLDAYGALVDAAYQFTRAGGELDPLASKMLAGFGETAAKLWKEPDEGIWEPRGGRRHHTLSKAMCWVALDRLQSLSYEGRVRVDRDGLRRVSRSIRSEIESRGYNRALGSYVGELGGDQLDSGLLLLSLYGYAEPGNSRMRSTVERIVAGLSSGPLLRRYAARPDEIGPAEEGAFGLCAFWAVECLAAQGDVSAARVRFESLLGYANDLGLFAEEIDHRTGAALGNFPQAYTHVGVINAATAIRRASEAREGSARTRSASMSVPGRAAENGADERGKEDAVAARPHVPEPAESAGAPADAPDYPAGRNDAMARQIGVLPPPPSASTGGMEIKRTS